jgi:sugar lactone lactonase YvrE
MKSVWRAKYFLATIFFKLVKYLVHLLDLSGQFIGFLLSEKDGIRGPNAMALDKEGNLWVGDTKSTVWIFKYSRVGENGPPS